ncbi:MAG: suppressor of fused domain protein [Deltaproteobacteria bacterium]|nr:suppressor of fused domain protein [Deltaproteobacteria bacterium]
MQQQSDDFSSSDSPSRPPAAIVARRGIIGENGVVVESSAALTKQNRREYADDGVSSRYRIRPEELLSSTTEDERSSLQFHISNSIMHFLDRELAVYVEGLGIFFPQVEVKQRTRVLREKLLVHSDTVRTVRFEKCSELVPYHWEKFGQLVETRELVHQFYPNLPLAMRTRWTEPDMRKILRGYAGLVRREVVVQGFSNQLSQIADLFALHNRQGRSENDWFAGADVFILPRYEQTLFIEPCSVNERPALENAWELLEAAFGKPQKTFTVDIIKQLAELGYDTQALQNEAELQIREFPVAVFVRNDERPSLVYCTNGLRHLSRSAADSDTPRPGNELIFQLSLAPIEKSQTQTCEIPDWPLRALTMGWILMQSSRSRTIRTGAGLACDVPLIGNSDTELHSIFATTFACARSEQLCSDRPFSYVNLVGITADEAAVAAKYSPEFLLRLLEHKELDQCTKPNRSSIVAKTGLLATPAAAKPTAASVEDTPQVFPAV